MAQDQLKSFTECLKYITASTEWSTALVSSSCAEPCDLCNDCLGLRVTVSEAQTGDGSEVQVILNVLKRNNIVIEN